VIASFGPPGGSASLILPDDRAWSPASRKGPPDRSDGPLEANF